MLYAKRTTLAIGICFIVMLGLCSTADAADDKEGGYVTYGDITGLTTCHHLDSAGILKT